MAVPPQSTRKSEEVHSWQDLRELERSLCSFCLPPEYHGNGILVALATPLLSRGRTTDRVNENRKGTKRGASQQGAQAVLAKETEILWSHYISHIQSGLCLFNSVSSTGLNLVICTQENSMCSGHGTQEVDPEVNLSPSTGISTGINAGGEPHF